MSTATPEPTPRFLPRFGSGANKAKPWAVWDCKRQRLVAGPFASKVEAIAAVAELEGRHTASPASAPRAPRQSIGAGYRARVPHPSGVPELPQGDDLDRALRSFGGFGRRGR